MASCCELTWHLIILPRLNREANIEDDVWEGRYQGMQALLRKERPPVHVNCKFNVVGVPFKRARLGY